MKKKPNKKKIIPNKNNTLINTNPSLQVLSNFGVLGALECTLAENDSVTKAASVDVLGFFVEFSPSMVRDHMLQQLANKVEEVRGK